MKNINIGTTIPYSSGAWSEKVILMDRDFGRLVYGKPKPTGLTYLFLLIKCIITTLSKMHSFDVVILDGYRSGFIIAFLARLLRINKTPIMMIDIHWKNDAPGFSGKMMNLFYGFSLKGVDTILVWSPHEVTYAKEKYALKNTVTFVPYHHTLDKYEFSSTKGDFVFSGGTQNRDYSILLEAMEGLPINAVVASLNLSPFEGKTIPENVDVNSYTPMEFVELMATCSIAVVCLENSTRAAGQQTFLNSMAMGKPTIIVGKKCAEGYIEDGVNGYAVEYGDAVRLRDVIVELHEDADLYDRISRASFAYAGSLSTEDFNRKIIELAIALYKDNEKQKNH